MTPTFDTGSWTPDNLGSASAFDRATRQWVMANDLVHAIQDCDARNFIAVNQYNDDFARYLPPGDADPDATNHPGAGTRRSNWLWWRMRTDSPSRTTALSWFAWSSSMCLPC